MAPVLFVYFWLVKGCEWAKHSLLCMKKKELGLRLIPNDGTHAGVVYALLLFSYSRCPCHNILFYCLWPMPHPDYVPHHFALLQPHMQVLEVS